MNKQRKVLFTITYNEMGIIIDTKSEEVAQPNLQPTCNNLATDLISRKWLVECVEEGWIKFDTEKDENKFIHLVRDIAPSAQPGIIRCKDCKHKPSGSGVNHDISFPDEVCPCQCDDYWYSWMPKDDWYCADAERREDGKTD